MNVVILAAGQGKRMRSALPKVLHPIAGRPMLAHVVDTARALGSDGAAAVRIVIVVGHGAAQVRAALHAEAAEPAAGAGSESQARAQLHAQADGDLHFVLQPEQRGTGHALQQALPQLDDGAITLVLYGDVPLVRSAELRRLVDQAETGSLALLTARRPDPVGYGRIVRDGAGSIRAIVEEQDADPDIRALDEINTGILAAPTALLRQWLAQLSDRNAQHELYLTDVVALAVAAGVHVAAVRAEHYEETGGVNSKLQLAELERVAQRRIAGQLLEQGATLADPARIDVRGSLELGSDVAIDVGCVFEGAVELGARVRVGPYCVLRNVRVAADSEILAFCHLDGARIDSGARVGPFSRLRPGADLGERVHIGNFVEVKASRIDAGAKANHLAYIGDASVGAGSNIGAGTIVANYDGVNKHRTEIGADVQVGSNSVLVAPVSIGGAATIAAGSTIARDAPAGQLTIARARQVSVAAWRRPVKTVP